MNTNVLRIALLGGLLSLASTASHAQALDPNGGPDAVIATRGGVSLTMAEVDAKIRSIPKDLRPGYLTEPDRAARFLDTMLLTKQLAVAAEMQALHTRENFPADLELARQELLARQVMEAEIDTLKLPNFEQLAKEQYAASPEKYRTPPRVDLRHILINTDGKDEETAKRIATEARARAVAGEDFTKLVMELSDEPSKDTRQGLIENADLKKLDIEFAKSVARLQKVGDISEPVRSRFGYHVILLVRLDAPKPIPFDAVKLEIIKELREQYVSSEKNRYLSSFSQQQTDLNNELIKSLPGRYATSEP